MQTISCEEYKQLQESGEAHVLLDVREQDEWDGGHIEGAIHLPIGLVEATAHTVLPDKESRLIVHCMLGGRSAKACEVLKKLGYTNITNLDGGYLGYCEL